jgi:hypothetical protein
MLAEINLKVINSNGKQNRIELTFVDLSHTTSHRNIAVSGLSLGSFHPEDSILAHTKGKKVEVVINDKGEVNSVNGADEILPAVASEVRMDKRDISGWLNDYTSAYAVQDILNRLFSVFPHRAVTIGEKWGNTITLQSKAPINLNNLFSIEKEAKDSIYLKFESTIVGGTQGHFYLNGTGSGIVIINKNNNLPYLYESNSSSTTKTDSYEVHDWDKWLIHLKNHQTK